MRGILIPIGGNEDKGQDRSHEDSEMYTLEFIDNGILANVVRESGGKEAQIVVVTTASSIPKEVGRNYVDAFSKLGCNHVQVLDIRSAEQAESEEVMNAVKNADCLMFSGGDQSKIVDVIGGTRLHQLINHKLKEESFVLAGTSAGAMCMSEEMISGGHSTEALFKGGVSMRKGMALLPHVIIDTHFIQRGRFGRLSEAVAEFPRLLGLGLAEDTGLIIRNGYECEVIGSGMVIVFDPSKITHNNVKAVREGVPLTLTNLVVSVLALGDRFNLASREVEVLSLEEYDRMKA